MQIYNKYTIPVPQNLLQRIDRTSPAHVGKFRNAVDFIVPQTHQSLLRQMVRSHVKDDSNVGGPDQTYWNSTNFISIMHPNGEYTRYDHLRRNSAKVRAGQYVHVGQEIAHVGITGYTIFRTYIFRYLYLVGITCGPILTP